MIETTLLHDHDEILLVNRQLAKLIGLNEAIVLQQIHYWVKKTKIGVEHMGVRWVFNTIDQWNEQFPFWSYDTIKRALALLKENGVLRVEQLSEVGRDRTNYYTVDYKQLALMEQGNLRWSKRAKCTDAKVQTAPMEQGNMPSSISADCPDANRTKNTQETTTETTIPAPSASQPGTALVVAQKQKTSKPPKPPMTEEESAHQAACRKTWVAYCDAYLQRYRIAPVRNAKMSTQVKQLVIRIGQEDAPAVARFYVERVNERFVVQGFHPLGLLLKNAEGYYTQWATNRTITSTQAQQADKTAANYNAVDEAMALMEQRDRQRGDGQHVYR